MKVLRYENRKANPVQQQAEYEEDLRCMRKQPR